jgi:hypothetical protein
LILDTDDIFLKEAQGNAHRLCHVALTPASRGQNLRTRGSVTRGQFFPALNRPQNGRKDFISSQLRNTSSPPSIWVLISIMLGLATIWLIVWPIRPREERCIQLAKGIRHSKIN